MQPKLDHSARLHELDLFSIRGRLLKADIIKYWKVFHSEQDLELSSIFVLASRVGIRGAPVQILSTFLNDRT